MTEFNLKHVYESQQFDRDLMEAIFKVADKMKDLVISGKPCDLLNPKIMASLFYEPSTRTRFSFECAMKRLGGNVITTENAREFSSVSKGESLYDTTTVMNDYADIIVMRHYEKGSAKAAAKISRVPIINAGDGAGQHPTQALLDIYTIRSYFPKIDSLKIAMVGDLKYGRTVRSLTYLLSKYNDIKFYFVSPKVCRMEHDIKEHLDENNFKWIENFDLDNVLSEVDCVYMTRVQKERFHHIEDYQEAAGMYILGLDKVQKMKTNSIIMHPLPRVDEIPQEVDDDPRAKYFEQAQNGLYVRMALLKLLLNR